MFQCWKTLTLIDISCGGIKVNYQLHPEFIAAVQSLLFNPDHAADMGLQGRNYVLNNLSNLGIANQLLSLSLCSYNKKSMLISFSGVDGAGKSTQISLIANLLSNNNIPFTYLWARGGYTPGFETLKRFVRSVFPTTSSSWYLNKRTSTFSRPFISWCWISIAIIDLFFGFIHSISKA